MRSNIYARLFHNLLLMHHRNDKDPSLNTSAMPCRHTSFVDSRTIQWALDLKDPFFWI